MCLTCLQIDPNYKPGEIETRQVYGVSLQQRRNDAKIDANLFTNIVTKNKEVCHIPFPDLLPIADPLSLQSPYS